MQFPPPPLQFHTTRASADELEAYLKGQEVQAKEAEFLALARADDGERRRPCGEGGGERQGCRVLIGGGCAPFGSP